jgi:hypothetical protein
VTRPLVERAAFAAAVMALSLASSPLASSAAGDDAASSPRVLRVTLGEPIAGPEGEISPYVFGLGTYMGAERAEADTWSLRPTHFRFGGNMAERFNWRVDAWNAGADWYFKNAGSRWPGLVDRFLAQNAAHGVASSVTVPMLGWVARDDHAASFPVRLFPRQQDVRDGAGNGVDARGRPLVAEPTTANVRIDAGFVGEWVRRLRSRFGASPRFYVIGNEPMLWGRTHRDVHPEPTTYDEVRDRFLATAAAVRRADPAAVIVGPALWGYLATEQSAFDERGAWSGWRARVDRDRHGGRPFLEWFLAEVDAAERRTGLRLLDVVDVHFYPANERVRGGAPADAATRAARLAATRALWDPTYVDDSWIRARIELVPRLKRLAARSRPPRDVAIGEYNFFAETDVVGGLAVAEALAVFAREGVRLANYWTVPPVGSPAFAAFKLLRNYDDHGAALGRRRLAVALGDAASADATVLAARDPERDVTTVLLLNKSGTRGLRVELGGKAVAGRQAARWFPFPAAGASTPSPTWTDGGAVVLPPWSMGLLELRASPTGVPGAGAPAPRRPPSR